MSERVVTPEEREAREAPLRKMWAGQLRDLAACLEIFAAAMEDDDSIVGVISGEGVANHLSGLPKHIRDEFAEHLSDEAAAGLAADRRYWALEGGAQAEPSTASEEGDSGV